MIILEDLTFRLNRPNHFYLEDILLLKGYFSSETAIDLALKELLQ